MGRTKIAKLLSFIVTIGGTVVMVGWFLNIEVLKSIMPWWLTMKFSTALSFFLSGITLYLVTSSIEKKSDITQMLLSIITLMILLFMVTFLISTLLNVRTGIEDIFVKETNNIIKTTTSGRPSIGTMINFILVAITGNFTMFDIKNLGHKLYIVGIIILIIGSIAIVGYILKIPFYIIRLKVLVQQWLYIRLFYL